MEGWQEALAYLDALERSRIPIVVVIDDDRMEFPGYHARLYQQIGYLKRKPVDERALGLHQFGLNWPDPDQPCGIFMVDENLFQGATLSTIDGDDYFGLELHLGPISILLVDSNTNMDRARVQWNKRRHQTYLDLPGAAEIEEKWKTEPQVVMRQAQDRLAEQRALLAKRGVTRAAEMTDAELEAAGNRVAWRLRTSGRMKDVHQSKWPALFVDELAKHLDDIGP
jgi:hypothetical protein